VAYETLEPVLSKLFNICLHISHYPLKWKVAKITVLKKPNKETYKTQKSFRPISVLNTLGKYLRKLFTKESIGSQNKICGLKMA
jgi:hypothetical protein